MPSRLLIWSVAFILFALLLLYSCKVGFFLYGESGGIQTSGNWTRYGGIAHAWTIPIQLPGGFIAARVNQPAGVLMMLGGLFLSAYAAASPLVSILSRRPIQLGRYGWKAILTVLGLAWIPVPETMAWIYQVTVLY